MADHYNTPCAARGGCRVPRPVIVRGDSGGMLTTRLLRVRTRFGLWLLAGVLCLAAHAQPGIGAPPQDVAQSQARTRAPASGNGCELGEYRGPAPGRRNHLYERYIWAVTPEFARQYCMPEHTVNSELSGAAAVAFRMVEGADSDGCRTQDDGTSACRIDTMGRFEIYIPQSLNLPAANPEVKFFEERRNTSDWLINRFRQEPLSKQFREGRYQLPPGRTPRFSHPFAIPDQGYTFQLVYEHSDRPLWSTGVVWETGFSAGILVNTDLLILDIPTLNSLLDLEAARLRSIGISPDSEEGQYVLLMSAPATGDLVLHKVRLPKLFSLKIRKIAGAK